MDLSETIEDFNQKNENFSLFLKDNKLFLKSKNHEEWLPFSIDFLSPDLLRRKDQKNQGLIKAIGVKNNYKPKVLDTTAGLGRDSFILANFGCKVVMLERNPIIYLLLNNAVENAKNSQIKDIVDNLMLINIDAITYLQSLKDCFDVIYIDPMFPKTNKSRLVKKDMQIFREIVGDDVDSSQLLELALKQSVNRVVVKRMRKSPYLLGKKPSFEISGNTTRFDVYSLS